MILIKIVIIILLTPIDAVYYVYIAVRFGVSPHNLSFPYSIKILSGYPLLLIFLNTQINYGKKFKNNKLF